MKYLDKHNKELKNGDIINLHQTVNGEDIFIVFDGKTFTFDAETSVLDSDTLDIRYRRNLTYEYEYDKQELLTDNYDNIEWEIVGNIYDDLNEY